MSDRVAVMHGGRLVELGDCDEVILSPKHERTRELVASSTRATGRAAGLGRRDRGPIEQSTHKGG